MLKLIAIVGTNSKRSTNRQLLQYMQKHFADKAEIELVEIKDLPVFNKPADKLIPAEALEIVAKIDAADGVIIGTPEYDHSIPAVLMSALAWISYGVFPLLNKPVMITGASYGTLGSSRAQLQLRQILNAPEIKATVLPDEFLLSHSLQAFDKNGDLVDLDVINKLDAIFDDFRIFVKITEKLRSAQELLRKDAEVEGKEHKESYDKLIFATGSTPILPPIEGVEIVKGNREFKTTLENVQFVKLYQNAEEVINKLADKSQHLERIAVVGGGYIGVELAEAFERLGKEVVLVDIVDTVLNGYYDKDFTQMMAKNLEDHNIRLALGQTVKAIEGDGKVERLVTDKETFDVDMVVLAVGFRPNTALADGKIELFRNGAFLVDKKQETSIPGVYAVGDCATVYDNARKDTSYIALASNAVRTGIVGAYNACGHELEGIGVQGSNGISIYGLHMVSTGLTLEKAKAAGYNATETGFNDLQKPEFMKHDNHEVAIKIVFDKDSREILGAQMVSRDSAIGMAIHMFSLAIQEHVTIDKLALTDLFFLPHFNKPYNYITMAALSAEK
jgi:NADPH-dependent 2,4-dienoyl-CoA reductase/sulfur reductase-like enzyme